MDLFELFSSTASQRLQYTASILGPCCPIIATTSASVNKHEVHLQRMPRSATQGLADFFTGYRKDEMMMMMTTKNNSSDSKLSLVLEKFLDEIVDKLLPDGSRRFQCFVSCVALEMQQHRNLRGQQRLKVFKALHSVKELITQTIQKALGENRIEGLDKTTLLQSALLSIASTDTDDKDTLSQITTSIALAVSSLSSSGKKSQNVASIDLIGFPITNSRVLPPGSVLLSIPNDYHHNLITQRIRSITSGSKISLLLIKKFDFINFGNTEDDEDSSDEDSNSSDEEEEEKLDTIVIPKTISDIVQLYRQEINLSDTKNSTTSLKDDWLTQLILFCSSIMSSSSSSSSDNQPTTIIILCQQKLPEAARCINEQTTKSMANNNNTSQKIILYDGVDQDIFNSFFTEEESSSLLSAMIGATVPFRGTLSDLPLKHCFIEGKASISEVKLPAVENGNTVFELKVPVVSNNNNNTAAAAAAAPRSCVLCAPTSTIAKDMKKLVGKLSRCVSMHTNNAKEEEDSFFVQGGFRSMIRFSAKVKEFLNNKTNNESALDSMQSSLMECFGTAALKTVVSIMLSNDSNKKDNTNRTQDYLRVLRDPSDLIALKFDKNEGKWKSIFDESPSSEKSHHHHQKEVVPEFSWVLENVMVAAVDFISMLLKSDVYTNG